MESIKNQLTNTKLYTPIMIDEIRYHINYIYSRLRAVESELGDRKTDI
ncbi:3760_t:CDS:1, partial [Diversispora eburnea]